MSARAETWASRRWVVPLTLAAAALALPVSGTATWLGGAHGATPEELRLGVWLLKAMLLVIAGAVVLVRRLPVPGAAHPAAGGENGVADRRLWLVLALILIAAAVLRFYRLDTELWLDEIDALTRYVILSLPEILGTYDSSNHHPLYTILAKVAHVASGGLEWSIRIPAVLFGVASLWALWAFARHVTSAAESLLAVLLLALSYHHVWFSQNARGYTALLFFTLVGTLLFLRLAGPPRPRAPARLAWGYALLAALAVYTHPTAGLIAAGHLLALIAAAPWREPDRGAAALRWPVTAVVLGGVVALGFYALVLPQVVGVLSTPTMEGTAIEWRNPLWLVAETVRGLGRAVPGGVFSALAGLAVVAVGAYSYWRQSRLVLLVMMAPIVLTAATLVAMRHNLWPRFFFFGAGFAVLLALRGGFVIAHALFGERARRIAVAGAVAVALLSSVTVPRAWLPKQQFAAVAQYVEERRAQGDEVVALEVAAMIYNRYHTPGNWHLDSLTARLGDIERAAPRTWVVYTLPARLRAIYPDVMQRLETPPWRRERVFPSTVAGGEIYVLLRDGGSAHD